MKDKTKDCRDTTYKHDALPAQITRSLYIQYGVGRWNAGQIMINDMDFAGSDGTERVLLATTEITVEIPPEQNIKAKLLKVLQDDLAKVKAENHMREKSVQDKIDNLLAITYEPGEAS